MTLRTVAAVAAWALMLAAEAGAQPRLFEVLATPACAGSPKLTPELRCAVAADASIAGVTTTGRVVLDTLNFTAFAALDPADAATRPPVGNVVPVRELIVSLTDRTANLTDLPGARVSRRSPFRPFVVVTAEAAVTPVLLRALAERAQVTSIEPNYPVFLFETGGQPNDPQFSQQWGLRRTNVPAVWPHLPSTGARVRVAVIDSGLDVKHADIASRVWRNTTETLGNGTDDDQNGCADDEFGCDFVAAATGVGLRDDPHGHGTQVAGVIGAISNNQADIAGIAPYVEIIGIRAFGIDGTASVDVVATAIDYAVAVKATIINCSFGTASPSPKLLQAIDQAVEAGVLIVAAVGNTDGGLPVDNDATRVYPASSSGVLSVMASDQLDRQQAISRTGATSVHLAAPGNDIVSLSTGGGTSPRSGTSMAAPFVSGVAALAKYLMPGLTAEGVAKEIQVRARKVSAMKGLSISEAILDASFLAPQASTMPLAPTPAAGSPVQPKVASVVTGPPSEWIGRITIGLVALGAETTGLALNTDQGRLELAVPSAMLKEFAAMDGQMVRVFGATETRTTEARGSHTVVRVSRWERR